MVANAPSDTSPNSEMNTSLLVYDHQQSNTDIDRQVLARLDPEEIMDDEEEEEADEQHRNTLMSFDEIETPEIPPTTCRRILNGIATIVTTPLEFIFRYTCIRCDHATVTAKWYPLTFLSAFIWVSWFSFLIATIVERWVVLSGVSLSFFGLVLVAVGAEVRYYWGSEWDGMNISRRLNADADDHVLLLLCCIRFLMPSNPSLVLVVATVSWLSPTLAEVKFSTFSSD